MNSRFAAAISAAVLMTLPTFVQLAAQAPLSTRTTVAADPWSPPKTAWGDPDLQGSWPTASLVGTPFERPTQFGERRLLTDAEFAVRQKQFADEAERVRSTTESGADADDGTGPPAHWGEGALRKASRQTSLIVDPSNGRLPPYTPWGQLRATNNGTTGPTVAMEHSSWRNSFSSGPWNGAQDFGPYDRCVSRRRNGSDIPLSDALHVVERFTRTDSETLLYEVTVNDPKTWTRPWTVSYPLKQDFEYGLLEYACHEGNHYAMSNMLSGARAAERAAAEKK